MKFDLTIKQDQIKAARKIVVNKFIANTTIKGFRKGKAPEAAVIKQVGEQKIIEEVVNQILPSVYSKAVADKKLQPITFPQFTPKSLSPDSDWIFEVEIAQRPEVKLEKYKEAIKTAFAKDKIWTPEKGSADKKEEKPNPEEDQKKKLDTIFKTLLETCKLEIPRLLVEEEVNRQQSQLLDQINQMGMKVDDYLKARGLTQETLKQGYEQQAQQTLSLEFILLELTKDLKITVEDKEVEELVKQATPESKPTPEQISNLKTVLSRRKTIDKLLTFAA